MGKKFLVVLSAAALAGVGAAGADEKREPGWSYAYSGGAATATLTDERGRVAATLSCRPPIGDLVITDFTLERAARRADSAVVSLGDRSVTRPARRERVGGKNALVVALPQSPPILAGADEYDVLVVAVGEHSHAYAEGAAKQFTDIAYACWRSG